jgi:ABC-type transport system substrate-binding protein
MEERTMHFHEAQRIIGANYLGVPISQGYTVYAHVKELMDVRYNAEGHAMFNAAYFERQ